jgi:hypothetical protein
VILIVRCPGPGDGDAGILWRNNDGTLPVWHITPA